MAYKLWDTMKNSWNAFLSREPTDYSEISGSGCTPIDQSIYRKRNPSVYTNVINRISIDAAAIKINHVRVDTNDRTVGIIDSPLNKCLTIEANIDQTGRAFMQDVVFSMLDEGYVAIVPVITSTNPINDSYNIYSMRVGKIVDWRPRHVLVDLYDDRDGQHKNVWLPKETVGIIQNPFYSVMNSQNSTLQRLITKIMLLDKIDKDGNYGKLDMIIQLPYVIRDEKRRREAEKRIKDIEKQLSKNKYGIAYTDGTEKIVQLNRSIENNLLEQIVNLRTELFNELGWSDALFNGTANEEQKIDYYNGTIEPIVSAVADEILRKFLTKTAVSQKQSIKFYRDPFRLTTTSNLAEIADKFTRNAILSSNELRTLVGFAPVDDPKANELVNNNLNQTEGQQNPSTTDAIKQEGNAYEKM